MRVYEIAKEVGIPNKDLIAKIRALGLEVNNHMSSLDADDVARIKRSLEKEKAGGAAPAETKRLSTGGAVLRCRSAADKADGSEPKEEARPVTMTPPAAPPVVRRRVAAEDAPAPAPAKAAPAPEAPKKVEAAPPAVMKRPAAKVEDAPATAAPVEVRRTPS